MGATAHHDLPSGGYVQLRDPEDVTERQRRPLRVLMATMGDVDFRRPTAEQLDKLNDANDLLAVILISSWSFDDDVTVEAIADLPGPDYDEILRLVAPMFMKVCPSFQVDPDPDSPTSPSSSSPKRSRATAGSRKTKT